MSTNAQKNNEDQEIDLSVISKKISGFFQNINTSIFRAIQFCLKKKIILGILFVLGLGLGIFLDSSQKTYEHQIIVKPNFDSTDYLYSKVALLNSKLKEGDTVFLKKIGIEKPKNLAKIEIEPIVDIYNFINKNENDRNFELLKLLAEDGDLNKIVEENTTSKNYTYHLISYTTKGMSSVEKTLNPLMSYFNNSAYFKIIQKEYLNNTQIKMIANDVTIGQIDAILNQSSISNNDNNRKSDKLVFYNGDSRLNDVLYTKDKLIREQGYYRIILNDYNRIIKEISFTINKLNTESVNGKLKLILPLLFVGIYVFAYFFIGFYKKQSLLAIQNKG